MSISELIERDLDKIETVLLFGIQEDAKELCHELIRTYKGENPLIGEGLAMGFFSHDLNGLPCATDYVDNLRIIKRRLEMLAAKNKQMELKDSKREVNIEFKPVLSNTNNNINNNTHTATVNLKLMFEQARTAIESNEYLSPSDYEDIMAKINELEQIANCGENKRSKWAKCVDVMNWICDKGAPTAVAILPLITEIIK